MDQTKEVHSKVMDNIKQPLLYMIPDLYKLAQI